MRIVRLHGKFYRVIENPRVIPPKGVQPPQLALYTAPTLDGLRTLVRAKSRSLMWEGQQIARLGCHSLAKGVLAAASTLEAAVNADAKKACDGVSAGSRKKRTAEEVLAEGDSTERL